MATQSRAKVQRPKVIRIHAADNVAIVFDDLGLVAGTDIGGGVLDVASGKRRTCAEVLRLHNDLALFNPAPIT
jgi:hypothetical protein